MNKKIKILPKIECVILSCLLVFSNVSNIFAYGEIGGGGGEAVMPASPYTFGPDGQQIEDVNKYAKPVEMTSIVPKRPVAAKDKDGNRLYFTPSGKMSLKISKDGKMQFSLKTQSKSKDKEGNVIATTEVEQGTDIVWVLNDKEEITGYQKMGLGGKVIEEYSATVKDKDGKVLTYSEYQENKANGLEDEMVVDFDMTKSHHYNQYGKNSQWVMDELSQTKTVFDKTGQPVLDVDYEGNEIAWYEHNERGKLISKTDINGNITKYDEDSAYVEDYQGNKISEYVYKKDELGRSYLHSILDLKSESVTYYDDQGRQTQTVSKDGGVIKEYGWSGMTLIYTFDTGSKETTWYGINGKPITTTSDDIVLMNWYYFEGRLVGQWEQASGNTTIFKNEREEIVMYTGFDELTPEDIQAWVDEGLIERMKGSVEDKIMKLNPLSGKEMRDALEEDGDMASGDAANL